MSKDTVYHYCSVDTFYKIITNKELWMTDITKSNDSKELQFAVENFTRILKQRIKSKEDKFVPLMMFEQFWEEFNKVDKLFHICCFSKDSDSLSQWSMYANDATGLAVGFDKKYLQDLKKHNENIDFVQVKYSLKQFSEMINQKLGELESKYINKNDYSWYLGFMHYVIDEVMRMIYIYKNHSFAQENECRLVFNSKPCGCNELSGSTASFNQTYIQKRVDILSDVQLSEIKHYVSRGRLVSYRPLQINNIGSIINEIVIGPKSIVSNHDLKMILVANGIDLSFYNIKLSDSTYR